MLWPHPLTNDLTLHNTAPISLHLHFPPTPRPSSHLMCPASHLISCVYLSSPTLHHPLYNLHTNTPHYHPSHHHPFTPPSLHTTLHIIITLHTTTPSHHHPFTPPPLHTSRFYNCTEHFVGLSGLIELMRRAGQLGDAQPYIERAETASARSAYEPGLNYCKGLHKWWVWQLGSCDHHVQLPIPAGIKTTPMQRCICSTMQGRTASGESCHTPSCPSSLPRPPLVPAHSL